MESATSIENCETKHSAKCECQQEKNPSKSCCNTNTLTRSSEISNTGLTGSFSKETLRDLHCNITKCKCPSSSSKSFTPSASNNITCESRIRGHSNESFQSFQSSDTSNKSWICESKAKAQQDAIECCSKKKRKKKKCQKCCQSEIAPSDSQSPLCQMPPPNLPTNQSRSPCENSLSETEQTYQKQCKCSLSPCDGNTSDQDATESSIPCVKVTVTSTSRQGHCIQGQFVPEDKK